MSGTNTGSSVGDRIETLEEAIDKFNEAIDRAPEEPAFEPILLDKARSRQWIEEQMRRPQTLEERVAKFQLLLDVCNDRRVELEGFYDDELHTLDKRVAAGMEQLRNVTRQRDRLQDKLEVQVEHTKELEEENQSLEHDNQQLRTLLEVNNVLPSTHDETNLHSQWRELEFEREKLLAEKAQIAEETQDLANREEALRRAEHDKGPTQATMGERIEEEFMGDVTQKLDRIMRGQDDMMKGQDDMMKVILAAIEQLRVQVEKSNVDRFQPSLPEFSTGPSDVDSKDGEQTG
ncbi:MAG: hypothetical protein Q9170_004666 [Blastenia crenularia]